MKGMTIYLAVKQQLGVDEFGMPIESDLYPNNEINPGAESYPEGIVWEQVDDCLVGQPSADEVTNTLALYGKKIAYTVGIPKGDTHDWVDAEMMIWGEKFRTIGYPETGIQANIPLRWGQNIKVERYG